jgi:hypothetical protein
MLLRGISKVTAAGTGLHLIYSITYAMESVTTRLPETPLHELARSTLWCTRLHVRDGEYRSDGESSWRESVLFSDQVARQSQE